MKIWVNGKQVKRKDAEFTYGKDTINRIIEDATIRYNNDKEAYHNICPDGCWIYGDIIVIQF